MTEGGIFLVCGSILIFVFLGTPDLMDNTLVDESVTS